MGSSASAPSAAAVARSQVSRSGLHADGIAVVWTESRPSEGGGSVVVRREGAGEIRQCSPSGVSVGSRVHDYGGAAARLAQGTLYFVDRSDQRLYRTEVDGPAPALPLTPASGSGVDYRYGDPRPCRSGRWVVAVEERHQGGSVEHRLVAIATDGSLRVVPLVTGSDFVASPRIAPDGQGFAWVSWDHPAMPWDESALWLGRLVGCDERFDEPRVVDSVAVAGSHGSSVGQPLFCGDGALVFVWDRTGWWLPYRIAAGDATAGRARGAARPMVEVEAEFHAPDWALGQGTIAERPDGTLVARMHREGSDHLVRLVPDGARSAADEAGRAIPGIPEWNLEVLPQPCVSISGVAATEDGRTVIVGRTPTVAGDVLELPGRPSAGVVRVTGVTGPVARNGDEGVDAVAVPAVPMELAVDGRLVPGFVYLPMAGAGEFGTPPPLVVFCHGGPTGACDPGFDPTVQFFVGAGLGVACVDYRGSSGYGRAYRQSLAGQWGVADVDDCVGFAEALGRTGRVDGRRMAIRGTSAGGLTALGAIVRSDRFAGAVSWYGVCDLERLAAETHDFESRYLDGLVGPRPEALARYRERSPIHHADRITGSVLLLQGTDDAVVPLGQAEGFADRLSAEGVRCELIVFPGEGHGFRAASTIEASLVAELAFYRSLFRSERSVTSDTGR